MTHPLVKKKSPAERLYEDGWRGVLQFLTGNEIAKISSVSKALHVTCGKPGIWEIAISTICLTDDASFENVDNWLLPGKTIVFNGCKLTHPIVNDNIAFKSTIEIILHDEICPNLQNLSFLNLRINLKNIETLTATLLELADYEPQLQKLHLELRWCNGKYNQDCRRTLVNGLVDILPEEVEFSWLRKSALDTRIHYMYKDAITELFACNKSTIKFTLPGCIWADNDSNGAVRLALGQNTTVRSLTFRAPYMISIFQHSNKYEHINCFAKILVHPSLRNLGIADCIVQSELSDDSRYEYCNYTSLYYANPEDFSKSTLETLHIELEHERPRGLLSVLHCVADIPNLQKFTISWPAGGHPNPQQISMERLNEFLTTSKLLETYKERDMITFYKYGKLEETIDWEMLMSLFI
jgi:hypothetical protein